jgi:glycosyltransferase involved in cell wall biosynthesis
MAKPSTFAAQSTILGNCTRGVLPLQYKSMTTRPLSAIYLTSGAAGMYCGSCLRDNTLARSLLKLGCRVELLPTYTPIRTDEEDASADRLFYGGINVFLQQKLPPFRWLPRVLDGWLDWPRLVRRLTNGRIATDASRLGDLTVSLLRGEDGNQRKEVARLVDYLAEAKPDVVNLSNLLIAGCVPAIKRRLGVPVLVTVQGDDLFLQNLPDADRARAIAEIRRLADDIDGYIVFSDYYADFMSQWIGLPRDRFHKVPLGINTRDFPSTRTERDDDRTPVIGFFARHCPAKGLHVLVDAFLILRRELGFSARLYTAGWLGAGDRVFFDDQVAKIDATGLGDDFWYAGVVDRREKIEFLQSLDVMSVPTTYREPKGLFVLESLAAGTPVVVPNHGAFPELLASTGGGALVTPNDARELARALAELLASKDRRRELGEQGRANVFARHTADNMARATLAVYEEAVGAYPSPPSSSQNAARSNSTSA